MKKLLTLLISLSVSFSSMAQDKLSANMYTGFAFPFTDIQGTQFYGWHPGVLVGAGLSYSLNDFIKVRGDLATFNMSGSDFGLFFESYNLETTVSADIEMLHFIIDDSKLDINLRLGAGLNFYSTNLFNEGTRTLLVESPNPTDKPLSINSLILIGFNVAYPITEKWDITAGYSNRAVIGNDYLDGFASGDYNDSYGILALGFAFHLKKDKDPGIVEVEKKKYQNMRSSIDSLKASNNQLAKEAQKGARLEMEAQEKDMQIAMLMDENDSLKANVTSVASDGSRKKSNIKYTEENAAILNTAAYRIIVASIPTQAGAQRFVENTNLDASEMVIAYIEDLDTYRIVYKSFRTLSAAKKAKQEIQSQVPDAWIIKF